MDKKLAIIISAQDRASKQLKDISAHIDELGSKTKSSMGEAEKSTSRFDSTLGVLGSRIRFVAETFAIYGVGKAITGFAKSSVEAAAELQQTSMAFQTLIGNTKEANKVFAELVKYANVTPFQTKDIEQAAQTLLGFGTSGEQTLSIIKRLGDIVSVTGGDLNQLSLVTGQIFSQGKMRAQDMYQVINDGGAGVIKIMAQNVGGMKNLTAEFDKGGIPAKQYFDAVQQAVEKNGFAFHGAQKQADTFNGRLSTLKDTVTLFGMKLLGVHVDPKLGYTVQPGGLFDRMQKGILDLTNFISNDLSPALGSIGSKVSTGVGVVKSSFITLLPAIAGLSAAFTLLGTKMAIDGLINRIIVGFNTLRLITIPSLLTSFEMLGAFLATPFGLALAAISTAAALVTMHFVNQKIQAQQLQTAQQNLKTATEDLKTAQDNLAQSQLNVEGAMLNVKQAQKNYNDAVAQFGPHSLAAQQALHDLKQAEFDLKQTQDNTKKSLQELKDKQDEVAKDKKLIKHLQDIQSNLSGVTNKALTAGQTITNQFTGRSVTVKTSKDKNTGVQHIDFVQTFGGRGFAYGGFTGRGQSDDIAGVVHKGEYVIPKSQVDQATGKPEGMGNTTINFLGSINLGSPDAVDRFFERLNAQKEMGALGVGI